MLQPRRISGLFLVTVFVFVYCVKGEENIESSPRKRRQDADDVTTVLLVDNQGRSTFGRFLSVKPDLGLLTSTARTFIQEGVTTQYATQVLGTTLDNGRLYAHLLTKSSRVLYDSDLPTRSYEVNNNKKWNLDNNLVNSKNFVKNTDYISPNKADPYLVFPTAKPNAFQFVEKESNVQKETTKEEESSNEDEILKSAPSNNARVPYEDTTGVEESVSQSFSGLSSRNGQSNIKVFQITPKHHDMNLENVINYKDLNEDSTTSTRKKIREDGGNEDVEPSKVRERDSLPTFTVRNEFSPSGLAYLGDFPEFDINTERSKPTTAADRKAKLFFRPGKPNTQDLKKLPTVTYSGFADFTTVVGDTVIVFAPYTSEIPKYTYNRATSIAGEPTIKQTSTAAAPTIRPQFPLRASPSLKIPIPTIRPSASIKIPVPSIRPSTTTTTTTTTSTATISRPPPPAVRPTIRLPNLAIRPSFTIRRPKPTKSYTSQEFDIENDSMHTVVIDATDRHRDTSTEQAEQYEDMDAKSAVLAHEQKISLFDQSPTPQIDTPLLSTSEDISTVVFSPEVIEPSEIQTPMLSTPSEEDIAKIFASLQAAQNKQATEPLETSSTASKIDTTSTSSSTSKAVLGSTAKKHKPSASGATTIFFDDDYEIKNTAVLEQPTTSRIEEAPTTTTEFDTTISEDEEEEEEEEEDTTVRKEQTTTTTTTTTQKQTTTTQREETTTPKEQTTTPKEQTTTQKQQTTTPKEQTTTQKQQTTTQRQQTTTQKEQEATNEILTTSDNAITTLGIPETTPQIDSNEVDTEKSKDEEETKTDVVCTEGAQVIPTTVYKTLTYLTTFFIPVEETTTTSVKSNEIISTEIGFQTRPCTAEGITPTAVAESTTPQATVATTTSEQQTTTAKITTQKAEEETTRFLSEGQKELEPTTEHITTFDTTTWTIPYETTPLEITTERRHVTESEPETTEMTTENGEEIEVLFKTLYTTYTYLTTFFQESTTSIASRKEVITNVITSTLEPGSEASDPAVAGLFAREDSLVSGYKSKPPSFDDITDIAPTAVGTGRPTVSYPLAEEDIRENILDHDLSKATPILNDEKVLQTANGIKTYYTTYTYFTTIFVDGETEISSRTEVYTNYVTPSIQPTVSLENLLPTELPELILTSEGSKDQVEAPDTEEESDELVDGEGDEEGDEEEEDEEEEEQEITTNRFVNLKVTPLNSYNTTINRQRPSATENATLKATSVLTTGKEKLDNNIVATTKNTGLSYSTLNRGGSSESTAVVDNNLLFNLSDYETISTMVTDVRSSTSTGESRIIDNVDKRNVLDDQIVAETNNDSEIIPSPTLLLQTSYTTFTYFTTMYQGTTSSNIVSRLETVTNVVTETLTPTHTLSAEDLNLPITYFTTFTYWTTLYKEGITKVTSREETVSNIVTPSAVATTQPPVINITPIAATSTAEIAASTKTETRIEPTKVVDKDELTTYYTTYTYYTTSYLGNSTVLNSRLETVTNVVNETTAVDANQIARAIGTASQNQVESVETKSAAPDGTAPLPTGLLSTIVSTIDNSGTKTILSTDIYGTYIDGLYAKVLESATSVITDTITPTTVKEPVLPTGVVSLNQGKIVDAEGISTLYYTTKAVGTFIDNLYAQVIESTSSLKVDEERKSALVTDEPITHKTGLVRLIEGSIVQNRTTTLYQSKVIGTVIEGRYAQIIESTSSFIIEKTQAPSISPSAASGIAPTATQGPNQPISTTAILISPSPVVIEGSLSDSTRTEDENTTESDDEEGEEGEEEEDDENSTVGANGRKKSRLTFQTRKRTFTPVIRPFASRGRPTFAPKRKGLGPSGATTITRSDFTPTVTAVPASKSGGRFGSRKSSSLSSSGVVNPTASGSRRFIRPKSSSTAASGLPSSSFVPRGRSSSRIAPTASGSRKSGGKTSSQIRSSSQYSGNTRFARIRPTAASSLTRSPSSKGATPSTNEVNDDENDLTTQITENPTDFTGDDHDTTIPLATTTEGARRNQNPLLKLRRPPLARPAPSPRTPTAKSNNRNVKKASGNKSVTTTSKPKTTRPLNALQNRPRPGNGLFPRRGLFTTTTTPSPDDEDEDEDDDFEGEEEDDDTDYDGSNTDTQTEKAPTSAPSTRKGRANAVVSLRPFKFRQRSKRETNFSRFRRPPGSRSTAAPKEEPKTEAPRSAKQGRSKQRSRGGASSTTPKSAPAKRLSPTRASSNQGRSQFTLREKDKSSKSSSNSRSNFRRSGSQSQPPPRRTTTVSSRPKAPKLRTHHTSETPSRRKSGTSAETNSRPPINRNSNPRRPSTPSYTRSKTSGEQIDNFVLPNFNDGTITITHSIPTEITIPIVNGKITEYRNVITAKYSTEVLIPNQYSTAVNPAGTVFTILRTDSTNVAANGATEITRFILNETPTTTVIFTPTYIRGHKTSWSHVLPSTVYGVDQVVSTIKPKLAAQAPLANILLSQLLLGNPAIQPNPLLGLQNPGGVAATPTTEFKTRTTTYVTTVTSATSTVIPITFRGKEILTTIIDTSVNVVTATEFVTDTVVATPTLGLGGAGQLNSLLLPLLLQQQQQPGQIPQQAGLFGLGQEQPLQQGIFQETPDKYDFLNFDDNGSVSESEEFTEQNLSEDVTRPPRRKSSRKKPKTPKNITPAAPPKETSIVTLYVSGKTPGEFSTILSTVVVGEENQRRKRDVVVEPSRIIHEEVSTYSYIDSYVSPALNEDDLENTASSVETQSLESVLGDVGKYVVTHTPELFDIKPTKSNKPKKYTSKYVKENDKPESHKESSHNFLA